VPTTIYFSGSISGGRQDLATYREIVAALEAEGHYVLAGAVTSEEIGAHGEALAVQDIFKRDLAWIDAADLVVAEVSVPSSGVGYEIAYARYRREIPVICLYRPAYTKRCTAMISGDAGIELIEYEDVPAMLPRLMESIRRSGRYPDRLP
jgi:nucleoside 2-deoxyribosyltransferase